MIEQCMNKWISKSIRLASGPGYLDRLYEVYPVEQASQRPLNVALWQDVRAEFENENFEKVIELLIDSRNEIFPFKDGYIGYLRKHKEAIYTNPNQIRRIATILKDMTFEGVMEACSRPKESNQTIGPMFRNWYRNNSERLGLEVLDIKDFCNTSRDAILDAGDNTMKEFAKTNLGYSVDKGLDFIARVNNTYVIGEAKWITTPGGNQDKSFLDARTMATDQNLHKNVIPIMILDGVLYLERSGGLYRKLTGDFSELNIMSALILGEFLNELKPS